MATRGVVTSRLVAALVSGLLLVGGCSPAEVKSPPSESGQYSDGAIREKWLAEQAELYGLADPPTVQLVRYVTLEELPKFTRECAAEQGFVLDENGGILLPEEQQKAYDLARYICAAKYQPFSNYYRPLNAKQLDILYNFYINVDIPCIASLGYKSDPPPSREVFGSTYGTESWWSSRTGLTPIPSNEQDSKKLEATCPGKPPYAELYGTG